MILFSCSLPESNPFLHMRKGENRSETVIVFHQIAHKRGFIWTRTRPRRDQKYD